MAEVMRVAAAQQRSVDEVVSEAVDLYLKQIEEQTPTPPKRTLTDVQRLMEEFRRNQG